MNRVCSAPPPATPPACSSGSGRTCGGSCSRGRSSRRRPPPAPRRPPPPAPLKARCWRDRCRCCCRCCCGGCGGSLSCRARATPPTWAVGSRCRTAFWIRLGSVDGCGRLVNGGWFMLRQASQSPKRPLAPAPDTISNHLADAQHDPQIGRRRLPRRRLEPPPGKVPQERPALALVAVHAAGDQVGPGVAAALLE
jgi:hypothetical protein